MLTYVGFALALLKFINNLMNYIDREAAMKAGADAEIAKIALAIANKTTTGKAIMERVNALSPADVDTELAGLEPK